MANPELASITCDGCQNPASIKKLNNSNYLYLHCKKCGMDRRSGEDLQAKWQAAIDQKQTQSDQVVVPEVENSPREWTPAVSEPDQQKKSDEIEDRVSGKAIAAGTIGVLSVLAMIFKAVRG